MKLWMLLENTSSGAALHAEHGLSCYLEANGHKILFDTGQSGAFADNAKAMGVDLSQVDICVLSHGHYDHGGGLRRFLNLNDQAPVYLSRLAFSDCRNASGRYIGLEESLRDSERLIFTEDETVLDRGLTLYSCNGREKAVPTEAFGLTAGGRPDCFLHEQYLLVEERGKRILLTGCSHKGIVNLVSWFRPDVLIGGFHFMKLDPEVRKDAAVLDGAAEALLQFHTRYYTGHCTGLAQYEYLRQRMGDRLEYLSTGQSMEI